MMRKTILPIFAVFIFSMIGHGQKIDAIKSIEKGESILDLAFGEGNGLFVLTAHQQVKRINLDSISSFYLYPVKARSMGVSNSTRLIAIGTPHGEVSVFNHQEHVKVLKAHQNQVTRITFSPTDQYMATAGLDSTIRIWSTKTFDLVQEIETKLELVTDLKFSLDEAFLIYSTNKGTVSTFSLKEKKETSRHQIGHGWIRNISVCPDSTKYAVCGDDKNITLLSLKSQETYQLKKSHKNLVSNIQFISNDYLLSIGHDHRIVMNNVNIPLEKAERRNVKGYARYKRSVYELAGDHYFSSLALSNEKKLVAISTYGKGVAVSPYFHHFISHPHEVKIQEIDNQAVDTLKVISEFRVKKNSCVIQGRISRSKDIKNAWLYFVKDDKRVPIRLDKKGGFKHQVGIYGDFYDYSIIVEDWDKNLETVKYNFRLIKDTPNKPSGIVNQ